METGWDFFLSINNVMEEQRKHCTILIKRRLTGDPGPPQMLQHGELAMNEVDNTLYVGTTESEDVSGNIVTDMGTF